MKQQKKQKKFSLLPYLLQYKWHYLLGIVILLLVDLANLYIPQYTGEIIDGLSEGIFGFEGVIPILFKILFSGLVIMTGRFGWRYFIIGASRGIEYRLRDDMFEHLETLSARYFNSHKTGDLMAHFTNDLQAVRMAVGMAVVTTFDAVVMTLMVLVKMIVYVDFRLTLLAFAPLILVAIGCYYYGIESKKRQVKRQNAFSDLSDKVQESLAGVRVLKSFVQEEEDFKAFEQASINNMEKNLSVVKLRAVFGPALDAVTGISLLLNLLIGGKMVLNNQISIGQFVAFNSYIGMLVWPMIACGDCINAFSQASAAFQRIFPRVSQQLFRPASPPFLSVPDVPDDFFQLYARPFQPSAADAFLPQQRDSQQPVLWAAVAFQPLRPPAFRVLCAFHPECACFRSLWPRWTVLPAEDGPCDAGNCGAGAS